MLFNFLYIALTFLVLPSRVDAYLDPGSGSLLVQVLIGAILGSLYYVRLHWNKLANFFASLFRKNTDGKNKNNQTK